MKILKGKKVLWFVYREYYGFIPKTTGIVIEETETECLIKIGVFKKIWTFKYLDGYQNGARFEDTGYCKELL